MLGDNGYFGMGFSVCAGPAVLLDTANYPDAPALVPKVVAIFSKLPPAFNVKVSYFFLVLVILFVETVRRQGKGAKSCPFGCGSAERVPYKVSLNKNGIKVVHKASIGYIFPNNKISGLPAGYPIYGFDMNIAL
jgi:hypothetical protein